MVSEKLPEGAQPPRLPDVLGKPLQNILLATSLLSCAAVAGCGGISTDGDKPLAKNTPAKEKLVLKDVSSWKAEWGQQEEWNSIYWWKMRNDKSHKVADRLIEKRKQLVDELARFVPGETLPSILLDEIDTFNKQLETGSYADYFTMFGGKRPERMPQELEFIPMAKIEKIDTSLRSIPSQLRK